MAETIEIKGKEYVLVDIDKLKPYVKNPRQNDKAVEKVIESIKKFGFVAPLIVRKSDNMIIAGHTRWKAAKKLGLNKIPVIYVDMTDNDAALYNIADNKLAEIADWDYDLLEEIAEDFNFDIEDFKLIGWEENELKDIFYIDDLDEEDIKENNENEEKSIYAVLIEVENEEEQKNIFEEMTGRGYKCKLYLL